MFHDLQQHHHGSYSYMSHPSSCNYKSELQQQQQRHLENDTWISRKRRQHDMMETIYRENSFTPFATTQSQHYTKPYEAHEANVPLPCLGNSYENDFYNGYTNNLKYKQNGEMRMNGTARYQQAAADQNNHIMTQQFHQTQGTISPHTKENEFEKIFKVHFDPNNPPAQKNKPTRNTCYMCGKDYARPSTLKTHMRIHSGERPFHCKICNKSFSQAANLTAHLRVHSGEKPFSCSICHKTFSQSSSVTTHMRIHSGDRPYKCHVCQKGFSDSSTLTKHMRIHSGEKPYHCSYCSMSFSQSGNLNRHMKVHEGQQSQHPSIYPDPHSFSPNVF